MRKEPGLEPSQKACELQSLEVPQQKGQLEYFASLDCRLAAYGLPSAAEIAASTDPAYLSQFVQDGSFWQLLAYCAGVGGSILIIGSAAGIVVMGLEKITFTWYLRHFTFIVFLGYIAGIFTYYIVH